MLFSKVVSAGRKILLCGSAAGVLLLPYHAATAAGNMGDTAAAMRANAAAYPEFFAPNRGFTADDPAPDRARQCKRPLGVAATDWRCRHG
jgi:hypothetical protein